MSAFLHSMDAWLAEHADTLLIVAAEVAVLGLVALSLERLLARRVRPGLRACLIVAVLARAAFPFHVEVEADGWARPDARTALAPQEPASDAVAEAPMPALSSAVVVAAKEEVKPAAVAEASGPAEVLTTDKRESRPSVLTPSGLASAPEVTAPAAPSPLPWRAGLLFLWAIGGATLAARQVLAERALRVTLRRSPTASERVTSTARLVAEELGLARTPRCLRVDALPSAAVHGVLRPTLLVPAATEAMDDESLRAVVTHELLHVKRGDLRWAPLLALLQTLWWPHPMVHLLAARLRDLVEETRDAETCARVEGATTDQTSRIAYARLLLDVAEARRSSPTDPPFPDDPDPVTHAGLIPFVKRGRALTRRIHMIFDPPRTHPVATGFSAVALSALVWFGFVAAKAPEPTPEPAAPTPGGLVDVERQGPLPAWHVAIEARLDQPLESFAVDASSVKGAMETFAEATGIGAVVTPEAEESQQVAFAVKNVTARDVLDLIARHMDDGDWSIAKGALHVGGEWDIPRRHELRLYRIDAVLDALYGNSEEREFAYDDLPHIIHELGVERSTAFEHEGTSMSVWRGLLAVRCTDRVHGEIHAFLERLAARSAAPDHSADAWRQPIEAALDAPVRRAPAAFANDRELFTWICSEGHTDARPLILGDLDSLLGDMEESNYGTVQPEGSTVGHLMRTMLRAQGRFLELYRGAPVISDSPRTEKHLYALEPFLMATEADAGEITQELEEFLRNDVEPELWDELESTSVRYAGHVLIVSQVAEAQPRIAALLAQLERALTGN